MKDKLTSNLIVMKKEVSQLYQPSSQVYPLIYAQLMKMRPTQ